MISRKKQEKITVIIPAYNAQDTIEECLVCLLAQKKKDFEIIVVDDASKDKTAQLVGKIIKQNKKKSPKIHLISLQKNGGAGAARNAGAKASTTETIAFLDADCVANDDWLQSLLDGMKMHNCIAAVSQYNRSACEEFIAKYAFYELRFRDKDDDGFLDSASSCNFICKREAFLQTAGFSSDRYAEPAEDIDFFFRLSQRGKIWFVNKARVSHHFRSSLRGYLKQQKEYSRSTAYLFLKSYKKELLKKKTLQDKGTYVEIIVTGLFFPVALGGALLSPFVFFGVLVGYIICMLLLNRRFLRYLKDQENAQFAWKSIPIIFIRTGYWILGLIEGTVGFLRR